VLAVLSVLLKKAVEWTVIDRMPCTIKLLRATKGPAEFYDFEEYQRLAAAAREIDPRTYLIVLLGGEAGLLCGEMIALERADVDLSRGQLIVRRSDWNGQVTSPKGGRSRYVPLTQRLAEGLREHRHLRSSRVLCQDDGAPLTRPMIQNRMKLAARRSGCHRAGVHILRHTFCSHLAMRGAAPRAIQEVTGHQDLGTTQRYLHLTPAAVQGAIRLLDQPVPDFGWSRGDCGETAISKEAKANG
jgi:integrase